LIGWSRKRRRRWVAIVLPGLLLRALIPLGFMPMFGPGLSVQLILCEGYAPVPSTASDMSMDMPMAMPMEPEMGRSARLHAGEPDPSSHQDHSACPYGASPTLAATPALAEGSVSVPPTVPSRPLVAQVGHFQIAPRAQLPRGPPLDV
jgi:hypothetical protein